jgi:ElaB/YqjD/DUF883 family membrane-anchored ribosome-binding protein
LASGTSHKHGSAAPPGARKPVAGAPKQALNHMSARALCDQIKSAEDEMDNTTKSYGNEAMSAAENAANRLKNKASDVADKAQEKMDEAIDEVSVRAKEARDAVRDYANQAADKLDESIQTRPMTTLIGAVAVGFVLGALWKR